MRPRRGNGRNAAAPAAAQDASRYRAPADSLIRAATRDSAAWNRMAELVDTFGPRFSGTPELERAIDWIVEQMKRDGLENVHTEPVMVPRWVRGQESATLLSPRNAELKDAMMLRRMQARGQRPRVRLRMGAQTLPDVQSRNVVAEIRGRERPEEVVVVGGHIGSWDITPGAMDDDGGCVASREAVRLMKALALRPRRTVRVVLWTNEENGIRRGNAYRDAHRAELPNHVLAIESDAGVFAPRGFSITATDAAFEAVRSIGRLLAPIGADSVGRGGSGADIGPIMALGAPGMGLEVDRSRYFWYHHTAADTLDKLDPREVARSVAATRLPGNSKRLPELSRCLDGTLPPRVPPLPRHSAELTPASGSAAAVQRGGPLPHYSGGRDSLRTIALRRPGARTAGKATHATNPCSRSTRTLDKTPSHAEISARAEISASTRGRF